MGADSLCAQSHSHEMINSLREADTNNKFYVKLSRPTQDEKKKKTKRWREQRLP
jgi:hypothetical protein